jgi:hypothetical protein
MNPNLLVILNRRKFHEFSGFINREEISDVVGITSYDYVLNISTNLSIEMIIQDKKVSAVEGNLINQQLSFYPNPAMGQISIVGAITYFSVSVFDLSGSLVLFRENEEDVKIQDISPETYLLVISSFLDQVVEKLIVL